VRCPGFPLEDYGFYVLGSLTGPERDKIQSHLAAGCQTCIDAVEAAEEAWYSLALATRRTAVPRDLRMRVLDLITPVRPRWWNLSPRGFVFAGVLVVVALTGATAVGWMLGRRAAPPPAITVANVWPAANPEVTPGPPAAREKAVPSPPPQPFSTPDDAEKNSLLADLQLDLMRERDKTARLTADLSQKEAQLSASQLAAADAATERPADEELRQRISLLTARTAELERQVAQYRVLLQTQGKQLDQTLQLAGMVNDPALRIVRLRATEKGQSAEARAVISPGSRTVYFASQLPALPANRTYQLWVLRAQSPAIVSAGTFSSEAGLRAVLQLNDRSLLSGITALAITDEPIGGSPLPTGHKWMIGS
jgi:hypothetical protein